ncbi:MAG: hypothetical protein COW00_20375 [Bdellovibrio sp. CG12_big_fil_rev_8_21_14_0_65_39_13]|nr:MAG: hypothetical protein COW78_15585 [Bdellovibrio sp. CG22_combo_CG10-13_8_21_14_all_39_27]PIQ57587.1 MAG: hypothetical protein COW00_20375 [Bdellovibrio sp. CG12_big_fil_rev_8_21_14_0_65_39_13]PIR33860.1 MAG: hypothetical protein COV37_14795 [Bdellovibrio sp. CG11_big_fil_rev_8_21_14_0_20_39_38]
MIIGMILFFLFFQKSFALSVAGQLFSIEIAAPTKLTICQNYLWASSLHSQEIKAFDLQKGDLKKSFSFPKGKSWKVSGLNCVNDHVAASFWNPETKTAQIVISQNQVKAITHLPGRGDVKAIQWIDGYYFLLQDQFYRTRDFKNYQDQKILTRKELKPSDSELKKNPFAQWQNSMPITSGHYIDFFFNNNRFWFLDAFMQTVMSTKSIWPLEDFKPLGEWGVWEGSLMFPKAMTFFDREIVIADSGLKLLNRYDSAGRYVDSYTIENLEKRFDYLIDVASSSKVVFAADFLKNKIYALNLNVADQMRSGVFRRNHFQHPEVTKDWDQVRCLNCHDGTEAYHLNVIEPQSQHHRLRVINKTETKLPLYQNSQVSCSSCHENHHKQIDDNPHFLRKSKTELCLECHQDKGSSDKNHLNLQKISKLASQCTDCHRAHQANDKLLIQDGIKTCTHCHQQQISHSSHPINNETSCIDCHSPHHGDKSTSWSKEATCLKCHQSEGEYMGQNKHLQLLPKKSAHWNQKEMTCLSCHRPHDGNHSAEQRCLECHKEQSGHRHVKALSVALAGRAEGLVLGSGHRLSCITCHDPHRGEDRDKYLRQNDTSKIRNLCASCHTGDVEQLVREFHPRFERKKK